MWRIRGGKHELRSGAGATGPGPREGRAEDLIEPGREQNPVRRLRDSAAAGGDRELERGGGKNRRRYRLSGGDENRVAGHSAQDRRRGRDRRGEERGRSEPGLRYDRREREDV